MVKKFKKLALGGTFDILHKGHRAIISKAFQLSENVLIGLSSDALAKKLKKREVNTYKYRKKVLEEFLRQQNFLTRAKIIPINTRFGIAHKVKDLDAIIVTDETLPVAEKINIARARKGLEKLQIVVIEKVKAEDGKPISSTRIRAGEIDREGRIIRI